MHFGIHRVCMCMFVCPGSNPSWISTENCTPIFTLVLAPTSVEPNNALIPKCFWILQSNIFSPHLKIVIIRFQLLGLFCILSVLLMLFIFIIYYILVRRCQYFLDLLKMKYFFLVVIVRFLRETGWLNLYHL